MGLSVCLGAGEITAQRSGRGPQTLPPSPLLDGDFSIKPPFANAHELLTDLHVPHGEIHRFS